MEKSDMVIDYGSLQNLLGGLGDSVIMTDVKGMIIFMNKAAEELFE